MENIRQDLLNEVKEYDPELYSNFTEVELLQGYEIYKKTDLSVDPSNHLSETELTLLGFYIMYSVYLDTENEESDINFFEEE